MIKKQYAGTLLAFLAALALVLLQLTWPPYYDWTDSGGSLGLLLKMTGLRTHLDDWFGNGSMELGYTPVFVLWAYSWFSLPLMIAALVNRSKFIPGFIATMLVLGALYVIAGSTNTTPLLLIAYYAASAPLLVVPYGVGYIIKRKLA